MSKPKASSPEWQSSWCFEKLSSFGNLFSSHLDAVWFKWNLIKTNATTVAFFVKFSNIYIKGFKKIKKILFWRSWEIFFVRICSMIELDDMPQMSLMGQIGQKS